MPVATTVVVPCRNEMGNIKPLVDGLTAAADSVSEIEVIFVDDSDDRTPEVIAAVAAHSEIPVRLERRLPEQRHGRLAGAVIHGLRVATHPVAVVMDSDLQHRPQDIPRLVRRLHFGGHDVVVGSRYVPGGSNQGLDGPFRKVVSRGASTAARVTFPRKVGPVRDVSSGFYAVRLNALDLDRIHADGYKVLLSTLTHRSLNVVEEPIIFEARQDGESKATVQEGLRYLRLLAYLRTVATA